MVKRKEYNKCIKIKEPSSFNYHQRQKYCALKDGTNTGLRYFVEENKKTGNYDIKDRGLKNEIVASSPDLVLAIFYRNNRN